MRGVERCERVGQREGSSENLRTAGKSLVMNLLTDLYAAANYR